MRRHPSDDELLRSYLRGELPEPEADVLERRLLVEDELFDLLEALEAELLAAVGRGELPPAEREWVLRRLASSLRGRERLALARSLNALADGLPGAQPSLAPVVRLPHRFSEPRFVWTSLAAAAGLLLAIGLSWFALQQPHTRGPVSSTAQRPPAMSSIRSATKEKPAPPVVQRPAGPEPQTTVAQRKEDHGSRERPQPVKAVFTLSLTTLRGAEEVEVFHIAPGTEVVELQLDLEGLEDLKSFDVVVRDGAKGTVWDKTRFKPRRLDWGSALVLDIPSKRLPSGRYEVFVAAGTEELIKPFEVVQENH